MPAELLQALDAAAAELHATRSALIRGLIEDGIDSGELPSVSPTRRGASSIASLSSCAS